MAKLLHNPALLTSRCLRPIPPGISRKLTTGILDLPSRLRTRSLRSFRADPRAALFSPAPPPRMHGQTSRFRSAQVPSGWLVMPALIPHILASIFSLMADQSIDLGLRPGPHRPRLAQLFGELFADHTSSRPLWTRRAYSVDPSGGRSQFRPRR
ncbi:hypothetical protein SBV1_2020004 [Verrucomicrobia bacterium]|nr:hypothetical protein SBV1_2020004 [Verrucomicrobiota bacterium]